MKRLAFLALALGLAPSAHAVYPLLQQDPVPVFVVGGALQNTRSWRFQVNSPSGICVQELCQRTPIGGSGPSANLAQTLTLWDFTTQTQLASIATNPAMAPTGPNGWRCQDTPDVFLANGAQALIAVNTPATTTNSYFFSNTTPASWLPVGTVQYLDMRFNNGQPATVFPTSVLANIQYGIPDFGYVVGSCIINPGCTSPTVTGLTPTSGATAASATTCSIAQNFTANLGPGASAGNVTFTVTPPAGGTSTPPSNVVPYAALAASASSMHTLSRPGLCGTANFTVSASAAASCAPTVTSTSTITYAMTDGTNPVVTAPATITIECDSFTGAPPVSQTGNATVIDNCDTNPTITGFTDTIVAAPPPTPVCPGNYNIQRTFTGHDCSNHTSTATQTIQVRDTTPPAASTSSSSFCLWPPNHKFVCIPVSQLGSATVDDACSDPSTFVLEGCVSNQPDCHGQGGPNHDPDCYINNPPGGETEICVRAERCGTETDRIYSVTGEATDACGNSSNSAVIATITVPHDGRDHLNCISAR